MATQQTSYPYALPTLPEQQMTFDHQKELLAIQATTQMVMELIELKPQMFDGDLKRLSVMISSIKTSLKS